MAQVNMESTHAAQRINDHIAGLPEPKRTDVQALHRLMTEKLSVPKLWYSDGRNDEGRVVTNPTIGYGSHMMKPAKGRSTEWFRIGISATTNGISVYVLGIPDKSYLSEKFGKILGKAKVTGYCISFKALKDIDVDVLEAAIRYGLALEA